MSDDGNESRDSKNIETEEKSTPASPSHVTETKSKGITIYFVILHSLYKTIVWVKVERGGVSNWSCEDFWMILFISV